MDSGLGTRDSGLAAAVSTRTGQPDGWGGGSVLPLPHGRGSAAVDRIQAWIGAALKPVELPLSHTFTPGLYTRRIFMPKGTCIVSKIHRTQHPFTILTGSVRVWDAVAGTQTLIAPHFGITQPGTRRVLYILEDCIWATFHAGHWSSPEAAEADLIEPHAVPAEVTAEVMAALTKASPESSVQCPGSETRVGTQDSRLVSTP